MLIFFRLSIIKFKIEISKYLSFHDLLVLLLNRVASPCIHLCIYIYMIFRISRSIRVIDTQNNAKRHCLLNKINVFFSDLVTTMENIDVSAQMRCSFAQRKLGHNRSPLRRKVGIIFFIGSFPINFISSSL